MIAGSSNIACARDTAAGLEQFKHTAWTIEDGAPTNIQAIAQSRDGYLWLGTTTGAYRFDGVSFEHIPQPEQKVAQSDSITALLASNSGDVWLGHLWGGLSVYHDGRLSNANPAPPHGVVRRIVEDRDGVIWVATDGVRLAGLLRNDHGKWDVLDAKWGLPKSHLQDILAARDGTVWVAFRNHLMVLRHGSRHLEMVNQPLELDSELLEAPDGAIWTRDRHGVRRLPPLSEMTLTPAIISEGPATAIQSDDQQGTMFDRAGALWDATTQEVAHIRDPSQARRSTGHWAGPGVELYAQSDGLSGGVSLSVLEDREDDIWIGTTLGLDRFRPKDVKTAFSVDIAYLKTTPAEGDNSYMATNTPDGNVFLGANGAQRLTEIDRNGRQLPVPLGQDQMDTPCSDGKNGLWIGTIAGGLLHLSNGHLTSIPRPAGLPPSSMDGCAVDGGGIVWLALGGAGLYRYDGKSWVRFDVDPDLKGVWPWSMEADQQGRVLMYFGTQSLYRVDGDRTEILWDKKDIAVGFIHVIYRGKEAMLFGGETGLARYDGKRIAVMTSARYPFLKFISGIAQTASGDTWLITASGIVRVRTLDLNAAFEKPGLKLAPKIFDVKDGVPGALE